MKIYGLPPMEGGIRNISDKKQSKAAPVENPKASDTVNISRDGSTVENTAVSYDVSPDFPVRNEVIQTVAERIARNTYNEPEVQEKVADKMIESFGEANAGSDSSTPATAMERTERVETAQAQATDGYYDNAEILNTIAERLISAQGLSSLFGN